MYVLASYSGNTSWPLYHHERQHKVATRGGPETVSPIEPPLQDLSFHNPLEIHSICTPLGFGCQVTLVCWPLRTDNIPRPGNRGLGNRIPKFEEKRITGLDSPAAGGMQ